MNNKQQVLIQCRSLLKDYETPAGRVPALRGLDLHVYSGEYIAINGKSGAGKSTLINLLTGIDKPTSGEVWVKDKKVHVMGENEAARWRG